MSKRYGWFLGFLVLALASPCMAGFNSGSTGADGALNLTTPGTNTFDAAALGLDVDQDGIFHFTSIHVGPGVTVRFSPRKMSGPVYWLARSNVTIEGTLDLQGSEGQHTWTVINEASLLAPEPGAGGFSGGLPRYRATGALNFCNGAGPGGGSSGGAGATDANMTAFCLPLFGGSGGGGGTSTERGGQCGGGGAGGGAILISSSTSIVISGSIQCNGGPGGYGDNGGNSGPIGSGGGGGGGGQVRLVAPNVTISGTVSCSGGAGGPAWWYGSPGQNGRIRIEAFTRTLSGATLTPTPIHGAPYELFLPTNPPATIAVTRVGGVVVSNPAASFEVPDAQITNSAPVEVQIEAAYVPTGTLARVFIAFETGEAFYTNAPLLGLWEHSAATVSVTFASGYARGHVRAAWSE